MPDETKEAGGEAASGGGVIFKCKGVAASPLVNGEADISVTKDGFSLASLMDFIRVSWAEVTRLGFEAYNIQILTKTSEYNFSKLGYDGEPLYNHLLSAYGDKVRKCLFVKGTPAVKAEGDVLISNALRYVPIEVYGDCVLSLPPDLSARRVPLRFVTGFTEGDFSVTLSTLDGKETVYKKLGYDHAPVKKAIQDGIKSLREKLTDQILDIDPSLTGEEAYQLAKAMPGGLAAPMGSIRGISQSFASALEARIAESRAAETYKIFQEISGEDSVCVGFKPDWGFDSAEEDPAQAEKESGADPLSLRGAEDGETAAPDQDESEEANQKKNYMLWLAAPAPSGNTCAIEFAGEEKEAAATFVYKYNGSWDAFRIKLGMALEAIDWKREVIRLTDEELAKPEYELYRMANDRNEELGLVRSSFIGRAIHRSIESWKAQVTELLNL